MAKLVLANQTSGYSTQDSHNSNNAAIITAVENTLSRDGTAPNQMNSALDMNSFDINNIEDVRTTRLFIDGEEASIELQQLVNVDDLGDVNASSPVLNDVLVWDGVDSWDAGQGLGFTEGEHSELQTEQATTSGGVFEYTSIPSWVKSISIIFDECGTDSSTMSILIEIGDSGGYEVSGYNSFTTRVPQGTPVALTSTNSFIAIPTNGTDTRGTGILKLDLQDSSNTWVLSGTTASLAFVYIAGGSKTLSGTLDRFRIRTETGAFNNGSFNARFE